MCNICSNPQSKFSMTGLSGKMCTACHDAVLLARKGNSTDARAYFESINIQSDEAQQFVDNEIRESEMHPAVVERVERTSQSSADNQDTKCLSSDQLLNKIASDVNTVKSILIFFLIITIIGLGGTLIYVIQIVNTFKDLF